MTDLKISKLKSSRTFLELKDSLTFTQEERQKLNSNKLESIYKTIEKRNPFFLACKQENFWLANFYYKRGIYLKLENVLLYFTKRNNIKCIKFLLKKNVDMELAFMYECKNSNSGIHLLQLFIDHGYNPSAKPLIKYCPGGCSKSKEFLFFLIENGVKDKNYLYLITNTHIEIKFTGKNIGTFIKNLIYNTQLYQDKNAAVDVVKSMCKRYIKRDSYKERAESLLKSLE